MDITGNRSVGVRRTGLHLFSCAVLLGLSACGPDTTQPTREVVVSIAGPDTVRFGAVGSGIQLAASVSVSEGFPPNVTWRSNALGVATVTDDGFVVATGDGNARITASAQQAADTVTVIVRQVPVRLAFDSQPTHAAVNLPLLYPVTVSLSDSNGFAVRRATDIVVLQLAQNPSGATLTGTTTSNLIGGVAPFDNLQLNAAGIGFTLQARAAQLTASSEPFDVVEGPDIVQVRNTGDKPVGLVVDGQSTRYLNDHRAIVTDSTLVTVMSNATRGDEVIAFVEGRPPVILTDPLWSEGVDTVRVTFRDPMTIPVTAWIVAGPFEELRDRAISQAATTSSVWANERMGLDFSEFEIVDATTDPDASALLNTTRCDQRSLARSTIGVRLDRINVYYVGVVDNGRDRGYSCGDVIFMADRSGHELLVHEIGHSLSLGHVDNIPGYDQTNVMHSASSRRAYLTEGQVFRQHFNEPSALNALYGFQPNGVRRCGDALMTDRCMQLILRLWGDGSFPPTR